MNNRHELLDELEHVLELLALVSNSNIDDVHKKDIEKYLRWAARKAARRYWLSLETDVSDI